MRLSSMWKNQLMRKNSLPKRRSGWQTFTPRLEALEDRTVPSTFTVTNTFDDGSTGSLRWAITQANGDADPLSTINFNISGGGVQSIALSSQLPTITHSVALDGWTQPGWSGTPLIELDGENAGLGVDGLTVVAAKCIIRGFVINRFSGDQSHPGGRGIVMIGSAATGNVVEGNYIGTDITGTMALPNSGDGVLIDGGAANNTIGGTVQVSGGTSAGGLTLTSAAIAAGFSLSTFATNFPTFGSTVGGVGPLGAAFPAGGGVLVGDAPGNMRLFPTDTDGQNASAVPVAQFYGLINADGVAQLNGRIFMTQFVNGAVVEINPDGTFKQTIVSGLGYGTSDVVADPLTGHLFVGEQFGGQVLDVNPVTDTYSTFLSLPNAEALAFSADGKTLYIVQFSFANPDASDVVGFDTSTGAQVYGPVSVSDANGIAIGAGTLAGNLFLDTTKGSVVVLNLATNTQTLIASGGSFGSFSTVDPNNGTLLFSQSSLMVRLTPPPGGSFVTSVPPNGNRIGGHVAGAGNVIAFNTGAGVVVGNSAADSSAVSNAIRGNSIHDNGGLGIDLVGNGVTVNDSQGHTGPNNFQDFPALASAVSSSTDTAITGTFSWGTESGLAGQPITLDFYANPSPAHLFTDGHYYGEGETYLGSITANTDASGKDVTFVADLAVGNLAGQWISATATDQNGNTSEFSFDVQATASGQTYIQNVQAGLPQSSTTANWVTIQASATNTPAVVTPAVNGLTGVSQPVTINLDLGGATYPGGITADPPPNVTYCITNGFLDPNVPALTVAGGRVVVLNSTLITSGNAPTLQVTGGSVTLRNDTILQTSTVYTDPAISVSGGSTVDLGTAASPGGNTLTVAGTSPVIVSTGVNIIQTVGNIFQVNGATVSPFASVSLLRRPTRRC